MGESQIMDYTIAFRSGYSFTFEIETSKKYLHIHFGKSTQVIEVSDIECRNLAGMLRIFGNEPTGNVSNTEGE